MSSAFKPLPPNRSGLRPLGSPPPRSPARVQSSGHRHLSALPAPLHPLPTRPLRTLSPRRRAQAVQQLPTLRSLPSWLHSLVQVQKVSVLVTLGLGATALAVYSWTFYSQHLWGQQYHKLEELRRNERQMTTYGEVMKNSIANQASRSRGSLVPKSPETLIFVKPSANRNGVPPVKPAKPAIAPIPPLGY
jgi:hypothetical protein